MMQDLRLAFPDAMNQEYQVEAGRWVYFNEEADETWLALGYSQGQEDEWFDAEGKGAGLYGFIPCTDPIPHYRHNCLQPQG